MSLPRSLGRRSCKAKSIIRRRNHHRHSGEGIQYASLRPHLAPEKRAIFDAASIHPSRESQGRSQVCCFGVAAPKRRALTPHNPCSRNFGVRNGSLILTLSSVCWEADRWQSTVPQQSAATGAGPPSHRIHVVWWSTRRSAPRPQTLRLALSVLTASSGPNSNCSCPSLPPNPGPRDRVAARMTRVWDAASSQKN